MSESILTIKTPVTPRYPLSPPLSCPPEVITVIANVQADTLGRLYLAGYTGLALRVATSCLLQPQEGDRVSAIIDDQQHLFVTAILSRQQPDTPLVLNSGEIPLHIVTPNLELHSSQEVAIHTPRFSLLTRTTHWLAETMHQVTQHLFVKAQHAHRQVENTDATQARHISQQAEQSLMLDSRIGSINASAVLKIDGGQVHMG